MDFSFEHPPEGFCLVFFFSNPAATKKRRLRKLGEIEGTLEAVTEINKPWRAVTPPVKEQHAEVEEMEAAPSPTRAATPPTEREEAVEKAAGEAAGASSRPDEAGAPETTVEPPPEEEASTRGAAEPEAAASAANPEENASKGQEEEATPEATATGVENERAPSPQRALSAGGEGGDEGGAASPRSHQEPPQA